MNKVRYVVYHNSSVYHIACIGVLFDFDTTLCGQLTSSKGGVQRWQEYEGGYPTPVVTDVKPNGKQICKKCESARREGRTVPKYIARMQTRSAPTSDASSDGSDGQVTARGMAMRMAL